MRMFLHAVLTAAVFAALGFVAFSGANAALNGDIGWPTAPRSTTAMSLAQDIGWPAAR